MLGLMEVVLVALPSLLASLLRNELLLMCLLWLLLLLMAAQVHLEGKRLRNECFTIVVPIAARVGIVATRLLAHHRHRVGQWVVLLLLLVIGHKRAKAVRWSLLLRLLWKVMVVLLRLLALIKLSVPIKAVLRVTTVELTIAEAAAVSRIVVAVVLVRHRGRVLYTIGTMMPSRDFYEVKARV